MSVVKIIELIGSSKKNFQDAFEEGIKRAAETVRNITGVEIVGQNAVIRDGQITEYRVVMKVAFRVE